MNKPKIVDIEVDGVDPKDYPDFSDAFFCAATWEATGKPLSDDELDTFQEQNMDLLNEMAFESLI